MKRNEQSPWGAERVVGILANWREPAPERVTPVLALRTVTVRESGSSAAARAPSIGGGTGSLDFYMKYLNF